MSLALNNRKQIMQTTYLDKFINYSKNKIAFIPLGTIEWHGNHLPIETDFMIAQKICEILSKKTGGYVLPPIYLGTDRERQVKGKKFVGMDAKLGKELEGNLYYLKPHILYQMIECLVVSLQKQGFTKVYMITGHGGGMHIEILEKIEKKYKNATLINPYRFLSVHAYHADEYETSLLWACYPEEESKSRKMKIKNDDDFFKFKGYDVREKASLVIGRKMLKEIIVNLSKIFLN